MNVTIIEQRDTNFGPARGYKVVVSGVATTEADLDREFAGIDCLVYMDKQSKIVLSNDIGYSYDLQRAERLAEKVEAFLGNQFALKRKRQVRDALNKCANPDIVEKVAKLLNV